jgi:hypothetical protein
MRLLTFLLVIYLSGSCNNHNTKPEVVTPSINPEKIARESFFPVTNYLKGQLTEIKNGGVNPLKFTTSHSKTDSMWLKMEDLTNEAAPFLEPVIDTANVSHLFRENKFLDQTINAYTFSYDPAGMLPPAFSLQRWDVYVDPGSGKVKRVYMVKKGNGDTLQQLTWQAGQWFKIVTISNTNQQPVVEKEVLIKWKFNS